MSYDISLSSLFRVAKKLWIYRIFVRHILSSVCVWWSQFLHYFYAIYRAVCYQLTHLTSNHYENIWTLSYCNNKIGSMVHFVFVRLWSFCGGCWDTFTAFLWWISCHKHIGLCVPPSLQWHHNGRDSVSNHQPHDCLLNRLFRSRWNKTSKLRVTGLCAGNSPGTGEFPAQMASNAENVSIWWRHHDTDRLFSWSPCTTPKASICYHARTVKQYIILKGWNDTISGHCKLFLTPILVFFFSFRWQLQIRLCLNFHKMSVIWSAWNQVVRFTQCVDSR